MLSSSLSLYRLRTRKLTRRKNQFSAAAGRLRAVTATESTQPTAATPASRAASVPLRAALPALVVAAGAIIGLASAQGGYFPTSWGLAATLLLWATGLWIVVSGRTDAGRLDFAFLGLVAAFTCWVGLSIGWSIAPAQSVLELERTVLVLAGVTAVLALARRGDVERIAGVVLAAVTIVSTYSLATRLFPDRIGNYDPVAGYRLSDPLGYWNSLGAFAAMGILLAVGAASDARAQWARAASAAALVPLAATLYYTYSRGAWLALAFGYLAFLALSPRRLRSIATTLVVAPPAAVAVLLASRPYALTHDTASLAQSAHAGHGVAALVLLLAMCAAVLSLVLDVIRRRVDAGRNVRLAFAGVFVALALTAVGAVLAREGSPVTIARRAWHTFSVSPPKSGPNLNNRLFSFSGNGRVELWRGADLLASSHPVTGSGAGTFERYWQRSRRGTPFKVRDAHSLYVETRAELGPPGLALLMAALLVPVGASVLVRRRTLLPAALGAYLVFLVHAGVDWDWELSGVTLTALLIGSLLVIAARSASSRTLGLGTRVAGAAAVVVLSMGMVVAYLGNGNLARAQTAVQEKSYARAVVDANRARRLMPWSPWPLITRGDAELASGDAGHAAGSYRHAIAIDPREWRAWFGLAFASRGRARAEALAHARVLYPTNPQITAALAKLSHATNG